MKLIPIFLIATLVMATALNPAKAQVDAIGHSTPKELADLRALGAEYETIVAGPYKLDWHEVTVYRFDLDGDGKKEAILRFNGMFICGASSCFMLVVKWVAGKATVVSLLNDSELWMLKSRSNGWYDLRGHYYDYKWDGRHYEFICRPAGVCEKG